jgi:GSH-dependent disulfide-bond oxidoreductase
MIELYFAPTPNGWKISIMLEECGLPYTVVPVNITRGEQLKRDFLKISPNGRIPAIIDRDPSDGGEPVTVFETGAILLYLSEKAGLFFPPDLRGRYHVQQWLMWQMSGLGPMLGQNGHFLLYAPEKIGYAIDRYGREARRLYGVLDAQLGETGAYVAGNDYSIADIACFPWVMTHKAQGLTLDEFPRVKRWFTEVRAAAGAKGPRRRQERHAQAVGRQSARKSFRAEAIGAAATTSRRKTLTTGTSQ